MIKARRRLLVVSLGLIALSIVCIICLVQRRDLYLEVAIWRLERSAGQESAFARVDSLNDELARDSRLISLLNGKLGKRHPRATWWIIDRMTELPYSLAVANEPHYAKILPLMRGFSDDTLRADLFHDYQHAVWYKYPQKEVTIARWTGSIRCGSNAGSPAFDASRGQAPGQPGEDRSGGS